MNPLLQAALISITRAGLAFLAGYLVNSGIWTQDESNQYVAAGAVAVVWTLWTVWKNYHNRIKFLAALESPTGTTEAELKAYLADKMAQARGKGSTGGGGSKVLPLVILASLAAGFWGCAAKTGPQVTPAGQIAIQAKTITDAAATALRAVEVFTDQGLIPKATAVKVIEAVRQVGLGVPALVDALRLYSDTKGADGWAAVKEGIQHLQALLTDVLVMIPDEPVRQRIRTILQPVLDATAVVLIL